MAAWRTLRHQLTRPTLRVSKRKSPVNRTRPSTGNTQVLVGQPLDLAPAEVARIVAGSCTERPGWAVVPSALGV